MKIKSFTKKSICVALLAGASVGANAASCPTNLGGISIGGVGKTFCSQVGNGNFWNTFSFTLPVNGGSAYEVIDIPFDLGSLGDLKTTFTAMSLTYLGADGVLGGTGLNQDTLIKGVFADNFANLSMQVTPLDQKFVIAAAGGNFILDVLGRAEGTLGGVYIGSISVAAAPPVPEPESYAMFLAGLGLMGVIVRRRMRNQS